MKNFTIIRIIVDLVLLFLVINGWWVMALLVGIGATWVFHAYIEIFFAGLAFDALFGDNSSSIFIRNLGIIISVIILVIMSSTKTIIRK